MAVINNWECVVLLCSDHTLSQNHHYIILNMFVLLLCHICISNYLKWIIDIPVFLSKTNRLKHLAFFLTNWFYMSSLRWDHSAFSSSADFNQIKKHKMNFLIMLTNPFSTLSRCMFGTDVLDRGRHRTHLYFSHTSPGNFLPSAALRRLMRRCSAQRDTVTARQPTRLKHSAVGPACEK